MKFRRRWARVAWEKCIALAITGWGAMLPSKFSLPIFLPILT
jgi:hypothetical protein